MMKRIGELKADLAKMTAWGRGLEHDKRLLQEENARLKAECQARQAENSVLAVECDSLKAEVERLTQLNATISLRYDATKSMLDGCAKEIEEMEAEVEGLMARIVELDDIRNGLIKAGNVMAERLMYQGYPKTVSAWEAAKKANA